MKWKKFTLTTTTAAVDLVSATFDEIGLEGIEIEDNVPLSESDTKGMFIDILPELPPDDGVAKVSFYLEPEVDIEGILKNVHEALDELKMFTDLGECSITEDETEDKDWINNWKEFFKPFMVGDILILPTWETIPENAKYKELIHIDPGTAFGTGAHETTQLCIKQLEKYIQLEKEKGNQDVEILDVGTGSGILGIAALKLGAKHIFATDLDDNAIEAVGENRKSNDIDEKDFEVICGNIIDDEKIQSEVGNEKYDIVVANILAPVIIMLQKEVYQHLKHGGIFITSGIIDTKEAEVKAALSENPEFEILETTYQGEWVNITARRK